VDEPTAAAIGAGLAPGSRVLVVDLGGGTIDLSLVALEGGEGRAAPIAQLLRFAGRDLEGSGQALRCARVIGKAGLALGGRDIDRWIAAELCPAVPPRGELLREAEAIKCLLSDQPQAVRLWSAAGEAPRELRLERSRFEALLEERGLIAQLDALLETVWDNALKLAGVSPEWVQVGNETNDGMLWETGRASKDMAAFASMVNAGYEAVKEVFPSAKVVVHISNGFDNRLFRWIFDGLKANNARFDIIGMSLYPDPQNWVAANEQTQFNMKDMISRYNKQVMICEVGMPVDQPVKCRDFITDLIRRVRALPDNKGLGVFYWEPQCHNNWKGYGLGAFDSNGSPTAALDAFQ